jgi:hypothetical protein
MLKSTDILVKRWFNSTQLLYLLLSIAGSIAPWFWLLQDPTALLSPTLFLQRALENNIATALTSDLLISAIAFFCFVWVETITTPIETEPWGERFFQVTDPNGVVIQLVQWMTEPDPQP